MRVRTTAVRTTAVLAAAVLSAACAGEPVSPGAAPEVAAGYTTINVDCPATLEVGQSGGCTAWVQDGPYGTVLFGAQWSSSAPSVASVGSHGMVTGVSAGTAAIQATYGGATGTAYVNVVQPLSVTLHGPDQVGTNQTCGFWASIQGASSASYSWQASGATGTANASSWEGSSSGSSFTLTVTATSGGRSDSDSKTVTVTPGYTAICLTSAG